MIKYGQFSFFEKATPLPRSKAWRLKQNKKSNLEISALHSDSLNAISFLQRLFRKLDTHISKKKSKENIHSVDLAWERWWALELMGVIFPKWICQNQIWVWEWIVVCNAFLEKKNSALVFWLFVANLFSL